MERFRDWRRFDDACHRAEPAVVEFLASPILVDRHPADNSLRLAPALETANQPSQASFGAVSMGSYFKPLRRKIGVVTLVMACLFAAGWVRSSVVQDHAQICYQRSAHDLNSNGGRFQWDCYRDPEVIRFGYGPPSFNWQTYERNQPAIDTHWGRSRTNWQCGWLGVKVCYGKVHTHSGEVHTAGGIVFVNPRMLNIRSLEVPYWSIVIPLTLLSAYLLLSKPRTSQRKPTSEP